MKKYYFKFRLANGQTGTGYVKAACKSQALEMCRNRYGKTIDFYGFTCKREV